MPHARVKRLDTSKALAMPGVKAILTADDMPGAAAGATLGEGVQATAQAERGLTNEPLYQGEPILAVAATSEREAVEAIEAIEIEFEPLPFVVDPIESLRPGGANARTQGNVWMRPAAPPAAPGSAGPAQPGERRRRGGSAQATTPARARRERRRGTARPRRWTRSRRRARGTAASADRRLEVDGRRFQERRRRPDAARQVHRRVDVRQRRRGAEESPTSCSTKRS